MNSKDIYFTPSYGKECEVCGVFSFSHIHRAGTKPNDYKIPKEESLKYIRRELELEPPLGDMPSWERRITALEASVELLRKKLLNHGK